MPQTIVQAKANKYAFIAVVIMISTFVIYGFTLSDSFILITVVSGVLTALITGLIYLTVIDLNR
jgi:hypothetical protein